MQDQSFSDGYDQEEFPPIQEEISSQQEEGAEEIPAYDNFVDQREEEWLDNGYDGVPQGEEQTQDAQPFYPSQANSRNTLFTPEDDPMKRPPPNVAEPVVKRVPRRLAHLVNEPVQRAFLEPGRRYKSNR